MRLQGRRTLYSAGHSWSSLVGSIRVPWYVVRRGIDGIDWYARRSPKTVRTARGTYFCGRNGENISSARRLRPRQPPPDDDHRSLRSP